MNKFEDLTGQKFGKLTVIKRVDNKNKKVRWLCRCDCGNYYITYSFHLKHDLCKSCGCINVFYHQELYQKNTNKYDLSGEYGKGFTKKGEVFYFDIEDFDKIKRYCWRINNDGYVVANENNNGKQKQIKMHRIVMNLTDPNVCVDHIYHHKNDNRKSQLRIATNSQNQMNKYISSNNTSGVTGVYWHKNKQKWTALIGINGKTKYLGMFDNFADAVKTRKQAEDTYFKDYKFKKSDI